MYRLMIVDDEEEVRKGIIKKLDWGLHGYEIVGEAENGKEALEIAEKVVPDIIITDIKMPFLDGLKLSEILQERLPTTKVIILTGFDEFEFARKAIKLNVIEYVLKPISAQELIEVLSKVKLRLDEERAQKENIKSLREHYTKSLPILRDKFLTSLISSRISKNEIVEKSRQYELKLSGSLFLASILSIDYNTIASCEDESNHSVFCMPKDSELLKFAVLNIAEEILSKRNIHIFFFHNDNIVIITTESTPNRDSIIEASISAFEEIKQSIEKYLKFTVTIGVGTLCNAVENINASYASALSALDYRVLLGTNKIILIDDVEPKSPNPIVFDDLKQHSLISCIKVGSLDEIVVLTDSLFQDIMKSRTSYNDYQIYLLEILTSLLKVVKDLNVNIDDIFGSNYNLFMELYKFTTIDEVKEWLTGICLKISGHISRERQNASTLLVITAKEYIEKNYSDCEITIDKICKSLHISPNYFSTIFKKETTVTFLNYLINLRMDAAKELLKNTGLKTFEIAEKVGFSEPNYFSYSFKKNFGVSPSEYRNSL